MHMPFLEIDQKPKRSWGESHRGCTDTMSAYIPIVLAYSMGSLLLPVPETPAKTVRGFIMPTFTLVSGKNCSGDADIRQVLR